MKKLTIVFMFLLTTLIVAQNELVDKVTLRNTLNDPDSINGEPIDNYQTFPYDKLTKDWTNAIDVFRYYVSSSGDDDNDGLTWETAKLTAQSALNALPSDLRGYTSYVLFKPGGSYGSISTVGKTNGIIHMNWCGSFVDTANTAGKYSYWVRNGATNPCGSNDSITFSNTGSGSVIVTNTNSSNFILYIDAVNKDFAYNVAGYAYWGRIIVTNTGASASGYLMANSDLSGSTIYSEAGIKFKYGTLTTSMYAPISVFNAGNIILSEFEIFADGNSTHANSTSRYAMNDAASNGYISLTGTSYVSHHPSYDLPYSGKYYVITGIKGVYNGNETSVNAKVNFTNLQYNPGWLTTYTPRFTLSAGYKGSFTYLSASQTLVSDVSTYPHTVINGTTGSTLIYIANTLKDDGTTFSFGKGVAGKDYVLSVDGETADGTLTWMEDESRWDFGSQIKVTGKITGSDSLRVGDYLVYSYITAGSASWTVSSDSTKKDSIVAISVDLDKFSKLVPKQFNFKKDAFIKTFDENSVPDSIYYCDNNNVCHWVSNKEVKDSARARFIRANDERATKMSKEKHMGFHSAQKFNQLLFGKNSEEINYSDMIMVMWLKIQELEAEIDDQKKK